MRIATLQSGISAGTELTAYTGTNPYTRKRWDSDRRLYVDGDATSSRTRSTGGGTRRSAGRRGRTGEPLASASATSSTEYGAIAAGTWPTPSGRRPGCCPPAPNRSIGVFARIGAIALNAVHDAAPRVGDVVAVFGQGVPGLLVTQLLGLAGATVIAVDAIPWRLELARRFGADHVVDFAAT